MLHAPCIQAPGGCERSLTLCAGCCMSVPGGWKSVYTCAAVGLKSLVHGYSQGCIPHTAIAKGAQSVRMSPDAFVPSAYV